MLGAIIGDISGSKYEFNNLRDENLTILDDDCFFTDDTVCTIACMDWLIHAEEKNKLTATEYLRKWTKRYPHAGYGGRFRQWILSDNPKPYMSYGNGAAMRISPVAFFAYNVECLINLTNTFTSITHNHLEGMKGALTISSCIYMALRGYKKEQIAKYAIRQYPEISSLEYKKLQKTYQFDETCQGSVPQAIYCFLISNNFEDCIKKTVGIGGDCDTTASMSGAIAEAYYGIPKEIIKKAKLFLDQDMVEVINEFYEKKFEKYVDRHSDYKITKEELKQAREWEEKHQKNVENTPIEELKVNGELPKWVLRYANAKMVRAQLLKELEVEQYVFKQHC